MAQSNTVSEPSMEEIVNSIRRILENNDQEFGVSNNVETQVQTCQENPPEDNFQREERTSNHIFSEQNRLREYNAAYPQKKTMSLSDVAARVRAEARADSSRVINDSAPLEKDSISILSNNAVEEKFVDDFSSSDSKLNIPMKESMHSSVAIDQREDKDSVLISSDIGNQVSSSFDQLAKALQESDNRSIDQLSIEVLRPMLREWLDDNLPGIVERLVREEIERIARGPSRS
ncbi:hypothetical protein GS16_02735 [Candidatus Liberibacter solanacearum]|uniref:DUF2497 domain-containing protein n=2 Tax=Candidatus Liberibacter solanacearum TaxID=556287 RepID=A0A095BFR2_9HYPH|nr:DUF2497 domain-containing protein [Candidatus Liberibacter solanacearum]KGB27638.1 hypothetical protein GS16_02735 [Candidatus Liberibacter solanacearum]KJZ81263.1 hypothetical protein KP07_02000 [Candidatus Liberibacter solanacearum]KJZ81755.1 hypothetical protein DJ66_0477 [Candidatus Liberibacter solanacearum]KQC49003.1 hypothetical protein AP064_04300 [Candidatus Liberibacter solanacearum]